jgi:NAD(P)-dependent dehydrogenase (short-subunit alcohol dehydrogenase family)
VTGGGRGIGRAYAHLLAERGATVVVNDVDPEPAAAVAGEVAGLADSSDVSTAEGGAALVAAAADQAGRVDVLVANAGIVRWAGFPDVDAANIDAHLAVHLGGAFHIVHAAWPRMVDQGYGRIVLTTSSGVFGLPTNTGYAAAKGAVIGLMRSAARAGAKHGINVNAIAPAAMTRMAGVPDGDDQEMPAALVAPMAAYLAHEDCPVTGEIYSAGAGRFARIFLAATVGWVCDEPTVEDVAEHWAEINDEAGYVVPADLTAWSAAFLAHREH